MSSARLVSPIVARTKILLLAAALAVSASCKLQEPASIDGLDPDPATDTLVITPQDIRVPVGSVVIFSAPDQTVEGTPVTGPVEWTVADGGDGGTITTAGLFQASDTGGYTVRGKRSGKSGSSKVTVTTLPATLTSVRIAPDALTLQPGATFTFAVSGVMSDGSTVPVTGTWTATGGTVTSAGVYTAGATTGQFRLIVTQQGGTLADTAAVTISTAAPTVQSVQVTPTTVSLAPGGAQQFSAVGRMSDGSSANVTVTWSETGGSITSAGRYTAGSTAGTFRVIATQQGGTKADTSAVTITPAAPTLVKVEVTPTSVSLAPGAVQQFSAIGRMSDNSTSGISVTWSETGGTVTSSGAYTAGATAGTFRVIATQQGGTLADTASVTIAVPPPTVTLTAIEVSPASASVLTGATQQFSAVGRMSDNSTSSAAVTWSATGGTVSGSGLYTAGSSPGSYRIIAVEQGGTNADTSSITVSAPAPTLSAVEISPASVSLETSESQQFSAIGRMSDGSSSGVSVSWTASGGTITSGGLYTAGTSAGTFRVIATQQGGTKADTSSVTIALPAPTLTGVELTPASVSLTTGATQQFTSVGRMSDGSTSAVSVTYSETGGSITAGGLYTAGSTAGTFRVIAVRQGDTKADTSSVTITVPAPTLAAVEVTPASASLAAGETQQFTALGRMSDGSATSVAVTWSETGGTISGTGLYTAGATGGSFRVIAVQQGGSKADTASVTLTAAAPTLSAVEVTPATATVAAGATQQFSAVGRMSDNSTSSVTVTWSATGGTITTGGLYTAGSTAGTYNVIAVQQGGTLADTSAVTVTATTPPPTSGTVANPSALPTASGQLKNLTAYTALNVRGMAAGGSYTDPVTGVRVWKMTSATVPESNPSGFHFYSEGPAQASAEWAAGKHTLYIITGGGYLVDFTRGSGFSNWRPVPSGTKQLTFSKNPATPRIAYVAVGTQLRRYDTGTNSYVDTGHFPGAFNIDTWLQQDKDDGWFVALGAGSTTVVAWNSATGQSLSRSFSGLDEPYLERDGRYVMVNASSTQIWDLATNTVSSFTPPSNTSVGHVPSLRGFFVLGDVMTGSGTTPQWRVDPSPARSNTQFATLNGYYPDAHNSGMWVQRDAELGSDLTRQWFLRTSYDWSYAGSGTGVKEGLAFLRLNGSEFKLLLHHYSVKPTAGADDYWSEPRATLSVDGKLVMFDSNMNNGPRTDVFVAEVPVQ